MVLKALFVYYYDTGSQVVPLCSILPASVSMVLGLYVCTTTFSFCWHLGPIPGLRVWQVSRRSTELQSQLWKGIAGRTVGDFWRVPFYSMIIHFHGHVSCQCKTKERKSFLHHYLLLLGLKHGRPVQPSSLLTPPKKRAQLAILEGSSKSSFPFHSAYRQNSGPCHCK